MTYAGAADDSPIYGGCEGPEATYVRLISCDGHAFILKKEYAMQSPTLKAMMNYPETLPESDTLDFHLGDMMSYVLDRVCAYLVYKAKYSNGSTPLPHFEIRPQIAGEVLLAANYLQI